MMQFSTGARLAGRRALVTGAGGGIGRACALNFAREGAAVAVADLDEGKAKAVAAEVLDLGSHSVAVIADVSDPESVVQMVRESVEALGGIDVLVNGAIRMAPGPLETLSLDSWDALMNVGLRGYFMVTQAVGKHMIEQGSGVVLNITSTGGHLPYPNTGAYSACKAAAIMLAKSFALEWAVHGIRVCSISPGMIRTPMTEGLYRDPEVLKGRNRSAPLGRIGTADEVAAAATFLASDDAAYITATDLLVDGGFVPSKFMHVPGKYTPAKGSS